MPRNVDLNLLPALQAILEEQSVTRGAARLGLSQPAMSASLGKLRRHFRDELLTRNGNVYELTPLAQQLVEPTHTAVRAVGRLFANEGEFDPATAGSAAASTVRRGAYDESRSRTSGSTSSGSG